VGFRFADFRNEPHELRCVGNKAGLLKRIALGLESDFQTLFYPWSNSAFVRFPHALKRSSTDLKQMHRITMSTTFVDRAGFTQQLAWARYQVHG